MKISKPRSFDLSFGTAYAQAKEIALTQPHVPLETPGSVQLEQRGGQPFYYWYRYNLDGKRITTYLGSANDPSVLQQIEIIREGNEGVELLKRYSSDLRKIGFYSVDRPTGITLSVLFNHGILTRGAVLVGTHAFGVILNDLNASCLVQMTEDVDLGRRRNIELGGNLEQGFLGLLQSSGLRFLEVPQLKRHEPSTSFKVLGSKLKVDLLVPARREPYASVAIPELKTYATALPHFDFLLEKTNLSVALGRDRIVPVTVPDAGRFCVHKMVVYSLRTNDNAKRQKDIYQAAMLALILGSEQESLLREAIDDLPNAMRTIAKSGARKVITLLEEMGEEQSAQVLEAIG